MSTTETCREHVRILQGRRLAAKENAIIEKCLANAPVAAELKRAMQGQTLRMNETVQVEILAAKTGLSIANASQHLQQMRRAGIISARRDGKFVFYRLADESVLDLLAALRRIAERNSAEVERVIRTYFHDRDSLEAVSRDELLAQTRAGFVTVLDVRPPDEFDLGHLPGAVNIPLRELEARCAEFDPSQEIVAYCRGPYCVLSYEAVAALRTKGFKARRLEDGFPEWRAAGLPVETTLGH
jgi:ArsR family transcriptional regulator